MNGAPKVAQRQFEDAIQIAVSIGSASHVALAADAWARLAMRRCQRSLVELADLASGVRRGVITLEEVDARLRSLNAQ